MAVLRPIHPNCPICEVPMWLIQIELGDIADKEQFECKVCDRKTRRTVPHEHVVQAD